MKIGIITLLSENYGNRLQNYAVKEILSQFADEVLTIKYEKKHAVQSAKSSYLSKLNPSYIGAVINNRLKNIYHLNISSRSAMGNLLYFLFHKKKIKKSISKRHKAFQNFDEKFIKYEPSFLHIEGDDGKDFIKSYDAFVCGSDQIWNPNYPTASRLAFLQFAERQKRIAFSASIGIEDTDKFNPEMREWIKEIPFVSVREESAVKMVEEMTGNKPELLLDPTMLLEKEKWVSLAEEGKTDLPENFALCYFLGNKERLYEKYISAYLSKEGLDRVELLNSEYPSHLSLAPQEMLYAVKNASVVFTDSFHGAVFSIIFHKPFVVFNRSEEGLSMNSRLETLLNRFGLQDRVFKDDFAEKKIDFTKAGKIIESERKKAYEYLKSALKGEVKE